jgi:hypothetical protein
MQGKVTSVQIHADLRIDDQDAEVLEHVASFGFGSKFVETYSQAIPAERIDEVFGRLRLACAKIMRAKREALSALVPKIE